MPYEEILSGAFWFIVKGVAVAGSYYAGRFLARKIRPRWKALVMALAGAAVIGIVAGSMLRGHSGDIGPFRVKVSPTQEQRVKQGSILFLALGLPAAVGVLLGKPDDKKLT